MGAKCPSLVRSPHGRVRVFPGGELVGNFPLSGADAIRSMHGAHCICEVLGRDIWGRLGPAEAYAVPAAGLMMLGCHELFFAPSVLRRNLGCTVLTVGTLVIIGTKETLLPAVFLALFFVALAVIDRRLTMLFGLVSGVTMLLFSSIIAWAIFSQLATVGADIYGNSVSPAVKFKATLASMRTFGTVVICIAVLTIAVVARLIWRYRKRLSKVEIVGARHVVLHARVVYLPGNILQRRLAHGNKIRFSGDAAADLFRVLHRMRRKSTFERNRERNIGGWPGAVLRGCGRNHIFVGWRDQGRCQIRR